MADLAERYLREHVAVRCKPATVYGYGRIVRKNVLPSLGKLPLAAVERRHVAEMHYRLRKTPVAANDAVAALSRMFNRAEAWGMVPPGANPCRRVPRYRTRRLERFLTEDEFRRLGETLDAMEAEGRLPVHAAAALRLLTLTGCRRGEIVDLRWDDVHLEKNEIRLRDSKTGPRTVPLSPAAARVFADLPRVPGNPWVIAGRKPGARLAHITYYWYRVRDRAGLEDVRLHDLRHSFASRCAGAGRDAADDRPDAGAHQDPDHRALRPPRAGFGQGLRGPRRRQHRRRHPAARDARQAAAVTPLSGMRRAGDGIPACQPSSRRRSAAAERPRAARGMLHMQQRLRDRTAGPRRNRNPPSGGESPAGRFAGPDKFRGNPPGGRRRSLGRPWDGPPERRQPAASRRGRGCARLRLSAGTGARKAAIPPGGSKPPASF